jgi:hypothetical protein
LSAPPSPATMSLALDMDVLLFRPGAEAGSRSSYNVLSWA